jgi:hypothetical protein
MKRLFLGTVVALALGVAGGANATSTILFDLNGSAPGGELAVDTFDWAPDNALVENGAKPGTTTVTVRAQASLNSFVTAGVPSVKTPAPAGTEFTFELVMTETVTGIGTSTVALTPTSGTINIYFDPTADANQLAGTGYSGGDSVLILTGAIVPGPGSNGTFTDLTVLAPGTFPAQSLDQFAGLGNNYPNVMSDQGSGNTNLDFHVTFADPNFFKSDITTILIGLQDSSNNTTPFRLADAAALVVGVAPQFTNTGSGLVNGAPGSCAPTQTRCDFLIQTDAASAFNPTAVPEPGTLALLSLGLLGAGVLGRRKMH